MRTVEDLPFVPTTWTAWKRSCGEPSTVSSRRMRSSPKRMPNSSSESRCSSARPSVPRASCAARPAPARRRVELLALGLRRRRPAPWPRSPGWPACPRRARSRPRTRRPARARAGARPRGRRRPTASTATLPPGTPTVATGSPPFVARTRSARAAPRARRRARSRRPPGARGTGLPGVRADVLAPAAQRRRGLDRPLDLRLDVRVAQRRVGRRPAVAHQQVLRAGQVGPDLLGDERDHRVRERERLGAARSSAKPAGVGVVVLVEPRLDASPGTSRTARRRRSRRARARRGGTRRPRSRSVSSASAACSRERIQRSSTVAGSRRRTGTVTPSGTRSSTSREALNSLLASCRPCATFSSLKRTSCVEDIASSPKRTASAP